MEINFAPPQRYRAWNRDENRWHLEFDWAINPETGAPHWISKKSLFCEVATSLIICRFTGIYDIEDKEICEYDLVIPAKFEDIPNVIEYKQNGFYRVKKHKERLYFNPLGSCALKIIGNIFNAPF